MRDRLMIGKGTMQLSLVDVVLRIMRISLLTIESPVVI